MEKTFIFAGFGGQGMLLIGKFLAMACMLDGKIGRASCRERVSSPV